MTKRKSWNEYTPAEQAQRTQEREARVKMTRELDDIRAQATGKGYGKFLKRQANDAKREAEEEAFRVKLHQELEEAKSEQAMPATEG